MLASTILDRAERLLDFDRTAVGVPGLESTNLLTFLDSAVKDYFTSFEITGEPSSILRKEKGYTLVADTNLNGSLASGATSIVLDSSASFGTSGAVSVWGGRPDYAEFSGNNLTTTLSGVTGVSFAHDDGDTVSLLHALPSDFHDFRSEEGFEDGVSVGGVPYFFTSGDPSGHKFAIYDNGTTKYLHFPRGLTGKAFVRYNAAPTTVSDESSTVDIPTKDMDYAVWYVVQLAAPKLERNDMYQIASAKLLSIMRNAHIRKNVGKRFRTRPMRRTTGYSRSMIFD